MNFAAARRTMVENQIRTNRVTDPALIKAMSEVPREAFVEASLRGIAYVDEDLPLGRGRYLMEPLVLAQLLQAAAINPTDVVLDVGCGPGYTSAIAAHLASMVVALDSDRHFVEVARLILAELGIDTVTVVEGPLADGFAPQAPYDVIVFSGAISEPPAAIVKQLAEGGRMVAVIADRPGTIGRGTVFVRTRGVLSHRVVFDAATPYLPEFSPRPTFQF